MIHRSGFHSLWTMTHRSGFRSLWTMTHHFVSLVCHIPASSHNLSFSFTSYIVAGSTLCAPGAKTAASVFRRTYYLLVKSKSKGTCLTWALYQFMLSSVAYDFGTSWLSGTFSRYRWKPSCSATNTVSPACIPISVSFHLPVLVSFCV